MVTVVAIGHERLVTVLRKEAGGIEALRGALDGVQAREREGARTLEQLRAGDAQRREALAQLRQEHVGLRDQVYALKEDYSHAATALAQDVAALAADAGALRSNHNKRGAGLADCLSRAGSAERGWDGRLSGRLVGGRPAGRLKG